MPYIGCKKLMVRVLAPLGYRVPGIPSAQFVDYTCRQLLIDQRIRELPDIRIARIAARFVFPAANTVEVFVI
jgi:hypothetical protein